MFQTRFCKRFGVAATEEHTLRAILFGNGWSGAPHRTLRTPFVEEWLGRESETQDSRPDAPIIGHTRIAGQQIPVRRFVSIPPNQNATGDIDSMALLAGQSVGLVSRIKPVGEIVREMMQGAQELTSRRLMPLCADG
jgi:nitronate monooxygenase